MTGRRLILASASPARRDLLRNAGIDPEVIVSGVDEDDVDPTDPARMVAVLAEHNAAAVAAGLDDQAIVVGADSTLVLDGRALGKPHTPEEATRRWRLQRGREGVLLTGHHVIDLGGGATASGVARTVVRFANPDDADIAAYVATGEPLEVAGAFTLDGRGAAYVEGIEGDPSNVIGLSLPLLRRLLTGMGVSWTTLWR